MRLETILQNRNADGDSYKRRRKDEFSDAKLPEEEKRMATVVRYTLESRAGDMEEEDRMSEAPCSPKIEKYQSYYHCSDAF
jgi:hypothetical protein